MGKPRVIITSDIGGSDPDDMESMAHALLFADKLDIQAIISSPTKHGGRTSDIHKALDAYAKDYNNLKTWGDYPPPSELKSVVYQGATSVPGPNGYASPTAASKAIIKAAHEGSASDPLYLMAWGAMTDIAQAFHDDPSIADKVRIISSKGWNYSQDPHSRDYVYNNFKDVWWIESKGTHRGIYINAEGKEGNSFKMNEAKGHGALGDYFYNARPWGVKMGDSWQIAYLTDNANDSNPSADSWAGKFVKQSHRENYWSDDLNPAMKVGQYVGAAHVRKHQSDIYNDMYKMFDRADKAKSGSTPTNPKPPTNTDDPVVANNDTAATQKNKSVVVKVLQNDHAADGGLKLAKVDSASAKGGKVVMNSDGTVTYTPKSGYTGSDTFKYTAKDADGDTKAATVTVSITGSTPAPQDPTPTAGSGSGHGVVAVDDRYSMDAGKKLYFNSNHILTNDKGADGGLKATVGATSANGVTLQKWADGTVVYKAAATNGTDRIDYTLTDKDGSTDTGSIQITIKNGVATPVIPSVPAPSDPAPQDPTPGSGNGNGNGNAVIAMDDKYTMDAGKKLYFNTSHLVFNDKGADGGLKASVAAKSANGVTLEKWDDGTVVYKAAKANGTDKIDYVLKDKDGSTDTGSVLITIKNGVAAPVTPSVPAPSDPTPPANAGAQLPQNGNGRGVVAGDDNYKVDGGKTLYFNTRYVTGNDKGDGKLDVVSVDAVSDRGVKISWGAEGTDKDGTLVYKAQHGFHGIDKVDYKVVDKHGGYDIGIILIHVN